jgi:outer membrane protein assembly factor BamE (lipoprotein component of BamABCDE complex)
MTAWVRIGTVLGAALLTTGCVSIVGQRGYLADESCSQSVQPGVDNRQSVERTLGRPSFVSQFGEPVWYYVSSTTGRSRSAAADRRHTVLAVHFDDADNVVASSAAARAGRADRSRERRDATLGRNRSFFQDLFGNIGQVGAGAPGAGGGGGGRRARSLRRRPRA